MIMKRDSFFDFLKAIAIFFVVLGHVQSKGVEPECLILRNVTVGMNMPLFFAISGYFSRKTIFDQDWRRLLAHLSSYFVPLAFFSTFFTLVSESTQLDGLCGISSRCVKAFFVNGWFLWSLSIVYLMAYFSNTVAKGRFLSSRRFAFPVIMLLVYLASFLIVKVWHVPHARSMFPFFALGIFAGNLVGFVKSGLWGGACLALFLLVCCLEGDVRINGMSFYVMNNTFFMLTSDLRLLVLFFARILLGVIGVIGVVWAAGWVQRSLGGVVDLIAWFGTETLGVYLLHLWVLDKLFAWGLFPVGWLMGGLLAILVLVFTHCCTVLFKSHRIARLVIWGRRM